ncbi:MAG: lipoxygenase family protein [Myxococcota bacterium]
MIRLPQHDPSTARADELEQQRSLYRWDHEYLAPFPFLHIPYVDGTGVLSIYDVLAGSFAGLPAAEQPPSEWLIRKTLGAGPAIYELLERVPRTHWLGLMLQSRKLAREQVPQWVGQALRELMPSPGERRVLRVQIPTAQQLAMTLTDLLLRSVDELSTWVLDQGTTTPLGRAMDALQDEVVEATMQESGGLSLPDAEQLATIVQGFVRSTVEAVVGNARDHARQLVGREPEPEPEPELPPEPGRAADPWLPDSVKRIVAPAELLVNFMARMRRYHTVAPDGQMFLSRLIRDLPLPTGPNPTLDDTEFGRRPVAGTNPVMLRRVGTDGDHGLPEGFAVNDGHLQAALRAHGMDDEAAGNATLAQAVEQGRLFLTDFGMVADIPCQNSPDRDFFGQLLGPETARQRYLPAPYGLFYRWGEGSASGLWPIAIQLGRDPEAFECLTPADGDELWTRVKALYLCAEFNHHEMATHLAGVHFVLEAFAVATARQLHRDHPIAALLAVHLRLVLWNNFLGRQTLTNPQGFTEQLLSGRLEDGSIEIMRRHYRQWDFWDLHLPQELARRGVDDREALPNYPFRDDGLRLWDALHEFVTAYVQHYYPSARELKDDHELEAWRAELCDSQGGHVAGFPESFDDTEVLADVLTSIIFRSSVFHSGVNYGQFDLQCDPSHVPAAIYADPRRVRELDLGAFLPGGETTLTQAGVMFVLSELRGDCLGEYALDWFEDPDVWPMVAQLRRHLARIEREITLDNRTTRSDRPYEYLRPSLVTVASNV